MVCGRSTPLAVLHLLTRAAMGGGCRKAAQIVASIEATLAADGVEPSTAASSTAGRDEEAEARCACP